VATHGLEKAQIALRGAMLQTLGLLALAAAAFYGLKKLGVPTEQALGLVAAGFFAVRLAFMGGGWISWIGMMASALYTLYKAATMRRSPPLYLLLPMIARGIKSLSWSAAKGVKGMLAFGLAALMVGAGVALMGFGVKMAAEGIAHLFTSLASIPPTQLLAIAGAVGILALAFQGVGLIMLNPLVALGLMGFAAALFAVGLAFKNITVDKINAFKGLVEYTKDLDENAGVNLDMLGFGVGHISWALRGLDPEKATAFSEVMDRSIEFSNASSPEAVESATKLAGVIKEVAATKVSLSNVFMLNALGNLVDALTKATQPAAGAAAGAAGGTSPTTVVLKLNERELGKTIVELVNKKYNLRLAS